MSKQALGRGLGELMDAANKALPNLPAQGPISSDQKGLGNVIRSAQAGAPVEQATKFLPLWFLLSMDLLLMGLSLGVVYFARKPLSLGVVLFCLVALSMGAAASILGILKSR